MKIWRIVNEQSRENFGGLTKRPLFGFLIAFACAAGVLLAAGTTAMAHGGRLSIKLNGVLFEYVHPQVAGQSGRVNVSAFTFPDADPTDCSGVRGVVYCFPDKDTGILNKPPAMPRKINLMLGNTFEVKRVAPQFFHLRSTDWKSERSQTLWEVNTNKGTVTEEHYDDPEANAFGQSFRYPTSKKVLSSARAIGVSPVGFNISFSGGQIFAQISDEHQGPYDIELSPTLLRETIFYSRMQNWKLTRPDPHATEFRLESPLANYWWQINLYPSVVTEHSGRIVGLDDFQSGVADFGTEDVMRLRVGVEHYLLHRP